MDRPMLTDAEVLAQIPAARRRARQALKTEPHAKRAWYDPRDRTLHLTLINGAGIVIPVTMIEEFRNVPDRQLAEVEVDFAGVGLHWEELDADLSVVGLARLALGSRVLLRAAGSAGGASRSAAKTKAARRNGRKGGRPRRQAHRS
jgi:hypothetical protein